jgi:hypothetical protein
MLISGQSADVSDADHDGPRNRATTCTIARKAAIFHATGVTVSLAWAPVPHVFIDFCR